MIPTFQDSIQPIGECGIAFAADDKIITAGHVIDEIETNRFRFGSMMFSKDSYLFHQGDTDLQNGSELDVSIYQSEFESSLILNVADIIPGTDVQCHSWMRKGNGFEYIVVSGVVDEIKGNFFSCRMKEAVLCKGNSGSPLLIGNNVIGVLHGGVEQTTICVFQKILPFMI